MGGLAACAGGAGGTGGAGGAAFWAFLALLAFLALAPLAAFFSKARKARSARSVAARSVASATRQFTLAAADSLRVDGGRGAGSGSVSERRNAFVAGKYSSVAVAMSCGARVEFLADPPLQGAASLACGIISCRSPWAARGAAAGLLGPAACARVLAVESPSRASLLSPVVAQRARVVAFVG